MVVPSFCSTEVKFETILAHFGSSPLKTWFLEPKRQTSQVCCLKKEQGVRLYAVREREKVSAHTLVSSSYSSHNFGIRQLLLSTDLNNSFKS